MTMHWFCSPWMHQFACTSIRNNHLTLWANYLMWNRQLSSWSKYTHLPTPARVKVTHSDAWISHTLRRETPSCLHSCSPNGFKMKLIFFLNPITATSEKAYFTGYTENLVSKMSTDAICVTSVFNLYESILSLQLNYEPLRSEPQWIIP